MAKVSFAKLGLKVNNEVKTFEWLSGDEVTTVEVKQYLPIEEKLAVISNIVNDTIDENGFYNPVRLEIFTTLEILYAYTNFNITPKMKEDPFKLYDVVLSTGLYDKILEVMPTEEFDRIDVSTHATIRNIYNYKNSALGVIGSITASYSDLELDANNLIGNIKDPESLTLLKDVMTRLG